MRFKVRRSVERGLLLLIITCLVCLLLQRNNLEYQLSFPIKSGTSLKSRRHLQTSDDSGKFFDQNQTSTTTKAEAHYYWKQYQKEALAIFILSAVGSNHTSIAGYRREIKLNGWEARKHRFASIKCCFLWNGQKRSVHVNPDKIYWKKTTLPATQFTCPIKGPFVDVIGVTLEFRKKRCPLDERLYIKPFIPVIQPNNTFAVCVKIVYGNIDAKLFLDWLEFYREMKVDKVFMYTYNLTSNVEAIIRHYVKTGFLETRHFDFPWKKDGQMKREIGLKTPSVWQDEQVVVFDCFHRLYGYTYISVLDLDEFLLPRRHNSFKDMMGSLTHVYPLAAGFTFKSYIFAKNWPKTYENSSGSDIVQYLRRTPALYTRQKNILISERVQPNTVDTHEFSPMEGFKRIIVPSRVAAINHYRECYSNYMTLCNKTKNQILDTSMLQMVKRFRNRTLELSNFVT